MIAGTRLGSYEIQSPLGSGGMGEVYRARDSKLGRDVAIKILPAAWASDTERLARFEREARLLASLNHPHIAQIYGLEKADAGGAPFIVMELVEGETLADRIGRGPLRPSDALAIARQIADGLDAAHERGIVHRDLKPSNVNVTDRGVVKVLDFGLAKDDARGDVELLTHSPTVIAPTVGGLLLGTAPYMSPEQARGKPVDKRADIWAFGCVLYEMLAGRRAFRGETTTDVLAVILERTPDWSAIPATTPAALRRLVIRCLEKDPARRLRDLGDAFAEIDAAPDGPPPRPRSWGTAAAAAALLVAATAVIVWSVLRPAPRPRSEFAFTFGPPEDNQLDAAAPVPSPAGDFIAFAARSASGKRSLWVRELRTGTQRALPETDDAQGPPFWSPDGRWLAFFVPGRLKKVGIGGGPALTICPMQANLGGTWNADNIIVFAPVNRTVLNKVSAFGGTPEPITALDSGRKENSHRWPHFLPDGRHFLYTARSDVLENNLIYVASLDSKERTPLVAAQSNGVYAGGRLLFAREGTLMARPFDPRTLTISGEASAIAARIVHTTTSSSALFGASADGSVLAYQRGVVAQSILTWFDRTGRQQETVGSANSYQDLRLSPDGRTAAVVLADPESGNRDIWLAEMRTGTMTRFTSNPANDWQMAWSPDGRRLAFASDRNGRSSIYVKPLDGGEEELLLRVPDRGAFPKDWSKDGAILMINIDSTGGIPSLYAMRPAGDRTPFRVGDAAADRENEPMLRSDGRWVAFDSQASATNDVYVMRFPSGGRRRVSTAGGTLPRWKADGSELFYVAADGSLMAVPMSGADPVQPGSPATLFRPCGGLTAGPGGPAAYSYDVTADGMRFLAICPLASSTPSTIAVAISF